MDAVVDLTQPCGNDAIIDEGERVLERLGVRTAQPSEVESSVLEKMESAMIDVEQKKIEKLKQRIASLEEEELSFKGRRLLTHNEEKKLGGITRRKVNAMKKLEALQEKQDLVRATMGTSTAGPSSGGSYPGQGQGSWFEDTETDRGRMIRTGQITPFTNMNGFERRLTADEDRTSSSSAVAMAKPSFRPSNAFSSSAGGASAAIVRRKKPQRRNGQGVVAKVQQMTREEKLRRLKAIAEQEGKRMERLDAVPERREARIRAPRRRRSAASKSAMQDDGNEEAYQERMEEWREGASERRKGAVAARRAALKKVQSSGAEMTDEELDKELEKLLSVVSRDSGLVDLPGEDSDEEDVDVTSLSDLDSDDDEDQVEFDGGYRLPAHTYYQLFEFQQTGVKWMWELYCLGVGGIIADEMGLGKTIQSVAFLAGLYHSGMVQHPSLVVCPATVMNQWVREFHKWWPPAKVCVLHSTGRHAGSREALFKNISRSKGVIVTSYGTAKVCEDLLLEQQFQVVFLDEGHKIKNPNAAITLLCKQLKSPHRMILTGAPIQNNLIELWSLFDFVFPGKLGTLPVFETEFGMLQVCCFFGEVLTSAAIPITMGGYANASKLQVQISYKCAVVLRDLINPYLLRRMKDDVDIGLPSKQERVLFCPLQVAQVTAYQEYLKSEEVQYVLSLEKSGNNMLKAVMMLRKICNHPDLAVPESEQHSNPDFGNWRRSGKMRVIQQLLPLWKEEGHRVLWFTQTRRMLHIMERFAEDCGYSYLSMDGTTSIGSRAEKIDRFNDDPSYFLFLLTTRTGGLGINLTGADRVIIFDPDWNPSTDSQARERAWRIGQKKEVAVYRLITSGTVEEKIYQRQIYKQFLTNKILKDPRQKRFFHSRVMKDLLTLQLTGGERSETGDIFAEINGELVQNDFPVKRKRTSPDTDEALEGRPASKKRRADESSREEDEASGVTDLTDPLVRGEVENWANDEGTSFAAARALENSAINEMEEDEDDETGGGNEDNILAQLFSSNGIKSVLEHDAIMDQPNPDHMFVENEASMVAQRAARLLKSSKSRCDKDQVYVPTWTGRAGTAGGPPPPGRHSKRNRQSHFGQLSNTRLQQFSVGRGSARDADKAAMVRNFQSRPGIEKVDQAQAPVTWSSRSATSSEGASSKSLFQVIPSDVRAHAAAMATPATPSPTPAPEGPKNSSQSCITQFFKPTTATAAVQPMSSSSILQGIRERAATKSGKPVQLPAETLNAEPLSKEDVENLEHIKLLHSYLLMEGGEASSNDIIHKFGVQLISREAKFVFRSMLKEIASFNRESQKWHLRPAYR